VTALESVLAVAVVLLTAAMVIGFVFAVRVLRQIGISTGLDSALGRIKKPAHSSEPASAKDRELLRQ